MRAWARGSVAFALVASLAISAPGCCVLKTLGHAARKVARKLDRAAGKVADAVAPPDAVTGARRIMVTPESWEIEVGERSKAGILHKCQADGVGVDDSPSLNRRIRHVFSNITEVSHMPTMPWEAFLIHDRIPNAFTVGGGKVFVESGLFGGIIAPRSDDELAAVLAHEVAHVTCRHISEKHSWEILGQVKKNIGKRFERDAVFRGSFSTIQEKEADAIGLLYMALAGYDPSVVGPMWLRAHQRFGSSPGDYTYDHPLTLDRAKHVADLSRTAQQYYVGHEVRNPDYEAILHRNELIDGIRLGSNSGLGKLLEAFANSYSEYERAREEERKRTVEMRETGGGPAWLGVRSVDLPQVIRDRLRINYGVVVCQVASGSPAEAAGLRPRDVLLEFGGWRVLGAASLEAVVARCEAGVTFSVKVLRGGKVLAGRVHLRERP